MVIKVFSREAFKNLKIYDPFIAISITDPGSDYPKTESKPIARLNLQFDDLDFKPDTVFNREPIMFTEKMAQQIIEFVNTFRDSVNTIVVHCEAGISRSAGVAGALSLIYNRSDDYYFDHYCPNRLVYRKILNAYFNN